MAALLDSNYLKRPDQYSKNELKGLPAYQLEILLSHFQDEYVNLYDRLNLNSKNSSLPPSSDSLNDLTSVNDESTPINSSNKPQGTKKDRKPRDHGFGRQQKLPITAKEYHVPESCEKCLHEFTEDEKAKSYTAYNQIDLVKGGLGEYHLAHTRHYLMKNQCCCGHVTKFKFSKIPTLVDSIQLTPWRLVGPQLASAIVYL